MKLSVWWGGVEQLPKTYRMFRLFTLWSSTLIGAVARDSRAVKAETSAVKTGAKREREGVGTLEAPDRMFQHSFCFSLLSSSYAMLRDLITVSQILTWRLHWTLTVYNNCATHTHLTTAGFSTSTIKHKVNSGFVEYFLILDSVSDRLKSGT